MTIKILVLDRSLHTPPRPTSLKELMLFLPRVPNSDFLFFEVENNEGDLSPWREIGDLPIDLFARTHSKERMVGYRGVGPKTIKTIATGLRQAGIKWK